MPVVKQILVLAFFVSVIAPAFPQTTPRALRDKTLQLEIMQKTSVYDSLVLLDMSSYWSDDRVIPGFAFKNGECYRITMFFDKGTGLNSLSYNRVERKKEKVFDNIKNYVVTKFYTLKTLNNDSLNLKSRTATVTELRDQPHATVVVVIPSTQEFFYKNSYAPKSYQKIAWTQDRQDMLDAFTRLEYHLK